MASQQNYSWDTAFADGPFGHDRPLSPGWSRETAKSNPVVSNVWYSPPNNQEKLLSKLKVIRQLKTQIKSQEEEISSLNIHINEQDNNIKDMNRHIDEQNLVISRKDQTIRMLQKENQDLKSEEDTIALITDQNSVNTTVQLLNSSQNDHMPSTYEKVVVYSNRAKQYFECVKLFSGKWIGGNIYTNPVHKLTQFELTPPSP